MEKTILCYLYKYGHRKVIVCGDRYFAFASQAKEIGIKMHDDRVVSIHPQTWGDTSCGFGGLAGQAMTDAFTIVVESENGHHVFINGRYAYTVKRPNDKFYKALSDRRLVGGRSGALYEKHEMDEKNAA